MDDSTDAAAMAQRQQHQLLLQQQQQQQQQIFIMQQQQQQQPQAQPQPQPHHQFPQQLTRPHPPQSQSQQQAISRFPSNIDAHLRSPGLRSLHFQPPQQQPQPQPQPPPQHQQPQPQPGRTAARNLEMEMALQDAMMVCNPDTKRPFASVEDAVHRLLPYHVVSDYEAEEDDRILDNDTTGQIPSRLQQWDHNILVKIAEFTTTLEKQVLAFNIMTRKRALGEFRSEEKLMIEQALLLEEKQTLLEMRAEIESREKAGREAAEAQMRMAMAQAEHARAEAQAHSRAPMRASAAASQGDDGMGQDQAGNMEDIQAWENAQREEDEPSDDFLNDENEPENGDSEMQEDWRGGGELDLNTR